MKNEWNNLGRKVDLQNTKQRIYDDILLDFAKESIGNKNILDYGCGTGEIALRLKKEFNALKVKAWDESKEMMHLTKDKLGKENVFDRIKEIPKKYFDVIFCNLILCIVDEREDKKIMNRLREYLVDEKSIVYIGFCNPFDFDVRETNLQFRKPTGEAYNKHHEYKKIIKEGSFEIIEKHKTIGFYERLFKDSGFTIVNRIFSTPETTNGQDRSDFVIYKLKIKN